MVAAIGKGPDDWLSAVPAQAVRGWANDTLPLESIAPDFGAIPRDRTGGRAATVLALYESDLTNRPSDQCLDWVATEIGLNSKLRKFARALTRGVDSERARVDRRLNRYSERRAMDETSPVARNILRAAMVEMEMFPSTRRAVIISEAVKLCQMFDTYETGRFVNGVLGAVVRDDSSG